MSPLNVIVLTASVRDGRFARTITSWVLSSLATRRGLEVVDVDLADTPLSFDLRPTEGTVRLRAALDAADAVVIVTPEYDHAYPASLKLALEHVRGELRDKPVGVVSYGGISGGLRATEALRVVLAEKDAVTIRDTVSLHGVWSLFDAEGALHEGKETDRALEVLLDRLEWYAVTLRAGRSRPVTAAL